MSWVSRLLKLVEQVGLDVLAFVVVSWTYLMFTWAWVNFGPQVASEVLSFVLLVRVGLRQVERQMRGEDVDDA